MKKKTIWIVLAVVLGCFLLVNAVWFGWRQATYGGFAEGMTAQEDSNFLVPRYDYKDSDGLNYNVKFPDYLHATGNLAVSLPWVDLDNPWTDAIVIWPKVGGGFSYGALLYEVTGEDTVAEYQIYIDSSGHALDSVNEELVERHREAIDLLLEKAALQWPGICAQTN